MAGHLIDAGISRSIYMSHLCLCENEAKALCEYVYPSRNENNQSTSGWRTL